ncbi:unnamed protein product [Phaedon cochleariae]|uniref:Polynucleotide 5'-hydroxyl-kinase NOL9 n=1 Tax=Phaedon cochleariae TaxID=80249 RepID=A0A9P0DM25_PHACE|nr:unnamed protein product [Phaedon cochleariae]
MNENYVKSVRESLYKDREQKNMPRTAKKIAFAPAEYKSEFAFSSPPTKKQKKTETNGKMRKKKKRIAPQSSDEYFEPKTALCLKLPKRNQPHRSKKHSKRERKLSNDENGRYSLSPSKSETDFKSSNFTKEEILFPRSIKTKLSSGESYIVLSGSETDDSQGSFTLSDFFDTREHSLNESVTEAHAGIDYEFVSNGLENAKISHENIFFTPYEDDVNVLSEDMKVLSEDMKVLSEDMEVMPEDVDEETQSGDDLDTRESDFMDKCEIAQESMEIVKYSNESSTLLAETIKPSENLIKIVETFEIGCDFLVLMKDHGTVPFFGLFSVKVLQGEVEILGCVLDENSKEISVYSPRGSSLLSIKNSTCNGKDGKLSEIIPTLTVPDSLKEIYINSTTAVFRCKGIDDPKISFIEKHISQQIFPKTDKKEFPQVMFEPKGDWNVVVENSEWDTILETVTPSTKLLVTGGKGVGKSTFIRYAINRLLNAHKKIRVVDLDPGQPEFTVPGCVSYLTLTEPILGPNYTHLKQTERSYLSSINVGHDPDQYLYSVKFLMREVDSLQNLPTIINYMGFTSGIGLNIISSAITYILPTDVVQIDSDSHKRNFAHPLTVDTVQQKCRLFARNRADQLDYNLHKIRAMTDQKNGGWKLEPRQSREMCVLADLGRMMTDRVQSLTDWRLPMFEINLNSIHITDPTGAPLPPAAANANLVALCAKPHPQKNLFARLGHAIVRGVDLCESTLKIVTPENMATLEEVHHLVVVGVSGVGLPPALYMTADEVVGHVPYVSDGRLVSLGQITKRSYLPANKK